MDQDLDRPWSSTVGYRGIAGRLAELMGCDNALAVHTLIDLISAGVLPKSSGRRIEPVECEALKTLAFALAARMVGFSKSGARQVAMHWEEGSDHTTVWRVQPEPFGACKVSVSTEVMSRLWALAEA